MTGEDLDFMIEEFTKAYDSEPIYGLETLPVELAIVRVCRRFRERYKRKDD